MPLAPLVVSNDEDLASWQAGSQAFFLEAASYEVRKFCGWHISPTIPVTSLRCWFGSEGLIMLPSTHVTSVSEVSIDGQVMTADEDYFWDAPKPWIQRKRRFWPHDRFALISFAHGYDDCPPDVKAVIFEVMATAMELPASNASRVQTMQYSFELNPDIGIALSETQKARLGKYRVLKFG
jgi:hypothetical protein